MSATDFPQGPGNDAQLTGAQVPPPAGAPAVAPDVVVQPYATPDITRAQVLGSVPVVAQLLAAFHIVTISAAQEGALEKAVGGGVGLMLADAVIRFGRSHALR